MLELGEKPMVGHKIRRLRSELGLTQSDMAAAIGISSSYLNLIEHNQRPVTVALLFKLGQSFDIDLKKFATDDTSRLLTDITEIFADSAIEGHSISKREMRDFVNTHPHIASAIAELYTAFTNVKSDIQHATAATGGERNDGTTSSRVERVRQFLEENDNHFPELEEAAEKFIADAGISRDTYFADLTSWFRREHKIEVQVVPVDVMGDNLRRYDPHRSRVLLSEALRRPQRLFQLLLQLSVLTQQDIIDELVSRADTPEIADSIRNTLNGYFAAAVMMPYADFSTAARKLRYDMDLLGRRFGVSFEQVCHRLTTLNRPEDRGIPFFFIRIDPAGNVSKRLSVGEMQFARYGGTCARWVVHKAFRVPNKILTQIAELEEGQRVFTMARTVTPQWSPPDQPEAEFAVGLGCDIKHAKDIAYADGQNLGKNAQPVPIGIGCHVCERAECTQRSQLPLGYTVRYEPNRRRAGQMNI